MSRGIISYFTRHPTAANLALVVMLMLGVVAAPNMRAQFFPRYCFGRSVHFRPVARRWRRRC